MIRRLACLGLGHVWILRALDQTRGLVVCERCRTHRRLDRAAAPTHRHGVRVTTVRVPGR